MGLSKPRVKTIDCEDTFAATGLWPFESPAIIDVGDATFRVVLCVHRSHGLMRLYVEDADAYPGGSDD